MTASTKSTSFSSSGVVVDRCRTCRRLAEGGAPSAAADERQEVDAGHPAEQQHDQQPADARGRPRACRCPNVRGQSSMLPRLPGVHFMGITPPAWCIARTGTASRPSRMADREPNRSYMSATCPAGTAATDSTHRVKWPSTIAVQTPDAWSWPGLLQRKHRSPAAAAPVTSSVM